MFKKVVVTGSLAFDHIMSMPGRFSDHILPDKLHILNVSFIMNTFRQEFGGTGGNIAWNLGLLRTPSILIGAVGDDFNSYKKHLSELKVIDKSGIKTFKSTSTARGFVTTDKDDNQIWGFYEGAMKMAKNVSITKYLNKNVLLMIAPNDPETMLLYADEAIKEGVPYVFDPAFNISHMNLKSLKKAVQNSVVLIGNDYEITLIKRRLGIKTYEFSSYCNIVITTLGSKGALIQTKGKTLKIPPAKPLDESDPTGAGDAFRGGFLAGLVRDFPLEVCGKMGTLAAVYTVEKYGTQTHKFTMKEFRKRYKKSFSSNLPNF